MKQKSGFDLKDIHIESAVTPEHYCEWNCMKSSKVTSREVLTVDLK